MKYSLVLTFNLAVAWMLWSGTVSATQPFVLTLGVLSILLSLWICLRMRVVDQESVPLHFGLRIFPYALYLIKEIVISNIDVAKIILSPKMKLQRNLIQVHAKHQTEIGNVVLANSITLTPGTVSVSMDEDRILVHALNFEGAEDDLSGDMVRKIEKLEGN